MYSTSFTLEKNYNDNLYTAEKGFGFWEPEMAKVTAIVDHERALKSGGWVKRNFLEPVDPAGREVLIIKMDVPEFGTYSVNFSITALNDPIRNMTVFTSRRNMLDNRIELQKGKTYSRDFCIAVTPYIPALSSKRCNDKDIFISLSGENIKHLFKQAESGYDTTNIKIEITIEQKDVPVIWIAGDSTVTDQHAGMPYYPYNSCCGWAQTLTRFVRGSAVCNQAHSGLTTNCFRDDGHYGIVLEMIKPGDLFILQFGHNDQKRRNLSAFKGYADNIRQYVREVKEKGADVILCSPISRIPLRDEDGSFYSLLSDHARAVCEVAKELSVPFVDLHALTFKKWLEFGDEAPSFFMKGDVTHTNEYGGLLIASLFMDEYRRLSSDGAITLLSSADTGAEFPFLSPSSDTMDVPDQKPEPDIFSIDLPFVDIEGYPAMDELSKAFHKCLMDPCVMYVHPYAVMPRAQLLMVLFKALRIAGKRPYDGCYADLDHSEWDSGYVRALNEENLIDPATVAEDNGKFFFRPDDPLTYEELDSFLIRFMERDATKRDIPLDKCVSKAIELGIDKRIPRPEKEISERYEVATGNQITRGEVYIFLSRFIDIEKDISTRSINFEA